MEHFLNVTEDHVTGKLLGRDFAFTDVEFTLRLRNTALS